MLLLLVLSTAAIFYPALSQPARSEIFDESDYPVPFYRARGEWGEPMERPHKGIDIAHMIKDLEAMRFSNLYPQQGRSGKLVDSSGIPFKAGKRMNGAGKRNFDEIDRSGFNGFVKKNFDEIDRSGFNSLVKKNFDEIDRNGFNGFVKKNINRFETSYR